VLTTDGLQRYIGNAHGEQLDFMYYRWEEKREAIGVFVRKYNGSPPYSVHICTFPDQERLLNGRIPETNGIMGHLTPDIPQSIQLETISLVNSEHVPSLLVCADDTYASSNLCLGKKPNSFATIVMALFIGMSCVVSSLLRCPFPYGLSVIKTVTRSFPFIFLL